MLYASIGFVILFIQIIRNKHKKINSFNLTVQYLEKYMAQIVKNLPAVQETQVQSLGQEDPQRKEWRLTPIFV